jgi:cold shock CspA family protein
MHSGTVVSLQLDRGYGFIFQQVGKPDIFFHAKDLADGLEFDEQLKERRVEFDIIGTPQ